MLRTEHRHVSVMRILLITSAAAFLAFVFVACRKDMQDEPRFEAYEENPFYSDSLSSRQLVEGTVPRGFLHDDPALYNGTRSAANASNAALAQATGTEAANTQSISGQSATSTGINGQSAGNEVTTFPIPITMEVVNRGQNRYNIYCSPCHGASGSGDGMIVHRGFRPPPTYHQDRLRNAPVGHFFDVITHGFGAMPDYAQQLSPYDRWAVIAYIRALQLSMHATGQTLPTSAQQQKSEGLSRSMPTAAPSAQPSPKYSGGGIR